MLSLPSQHVLVQAGAEGCGRDGVCRVGVLGPQSREMAAGWARGCWGRHLCDCWWPGEGPHQWFDKSLPGACPAQVGCAGAALGKRLETGAVTVVSLGMWLLLYLDNRDKVKRKSGWDFYLEGSYLGSGDFCFISSLGDADFHA